MHQMWKLNNSASVLEPLVNNAKVCESKYICAHCLRGHKHVDCQKRENSTFTAALRLILKRKEKVQNVENKPTEKYKPVSWSTQNKKSLNGFTEIVRVTNDKSKEAKLPIRKIKASEVSAFAEEPGMTFTFKNKCSYDSTVSYDPSLMSTDLLEAPVQDFTNSSSLVSNNKAHKYKKISYFSPKNLKSKNQFKSKYVTLNYAELGKILPLNAVEIFPMPRKLQKDISEKYIQELVKPQAGIQHEPKVEIKLPELDFLDILKNRGKIINNAKTVEKKASYLDAEDFGKIQITIPFKEHKFSELLLSYIDVANSMNLQDDALIMLNSCRKKKAWKEFSSHTFLKSYNLLLHSYSVKGDWLFVNKILDWMREDNVNFDCQTYAAILDCLGRVDKSTFQPETLWKQEVLKNLRNLYNDNYSLNDLFTKTDLTIEKREKILEVIRVFLPYFEVEPTKTNLKSSHVFLQKLYRDSNNFQSPFKNAFDTKTIGNLIEEQLLLEKNFSVPIKSIYYNRRNYVSSKDREKYEELLETWKEAITRRFSNNLKIAEAEHEKRPDKFNVLIYLKSLPIEIYVKEMLAEIECLLNFNDSYTASTAALYRNLGQKIYLRYQIKKMIATGVENEMKKVFQRYCSWYFNPVGPATNSRQHWQLLFQEQFENCQLNLTKHEWPIVVKEALGKYLYNIIFEEVKVSRFSKSGKENLVPAFYLVIRYQDFKCFEQVKCHHTLLNLKKKIGFEKLNFQAHQLPMLCPPKPWKSTKDGGYLILPTPYVRRHGGVGKFVEYEKISSMSLYPIFDSLNVMQSVPWKINENVLDIIIKIFNDGGNDKLNVPKLPEDYVTPHSLPPNISLKERHEEILRRKKSNEKRHNEYALWCDALYKLSIANHFRKRVFWFPQNMDFRGRMYPVPPHFNHIGADLYRCLVLFAQGKPLGPSGLDWIKIHAINLTGKHKEKSVLEKLNYANSILPDILDSAKNPLEGTKWWMEAEEPWQTLAVCMEINNAVSSPCPESFVSHFPVHQDGSCNGLQHYAALGRDTIGAESVNLSPKDAPQDVYIRVTEMIERERQKDADSGIEVAKILEGFVRRKVIKQTVMTSVYGVTKYGARIQISKQLEDIKEFPQEHVWLAARYLTNKVFESLGQMFTSAKEIQDWFLQCADVITKRQDFVQWVSPLGFPVLQSYGKHKMLSKEQNSKMKVVPNCIKQKNAFAPNFIHSLDSTHLMLTSLFCEQAGITFASIHDCFWTHPNSVAVMNKICREQFLSLHSQPLLKNLSQFFIHCYLNDKNKDKNNHEAEKVFNSLPKTGDFDLSSVINSVYFFS